MNERIRMKPPALRVQRPLLYLALTAWMAAVACTETATEPAGVTAAGAQAPAALSDTKSFPLFAAAVDDARTRLLPAHGERGATALAAALADLSQALQRIDAQAARDAQRTAESALTSLRDAAPEAEADLAVIALALGQIAAALQQPAIR